MKQVLLSTVIFLTLLFSGSIVAQVPNWNWSTGWASNGDEIGRGVFVDSSGYTYKVGSFSGSVTSLPTMSVLINSGTVGTSDIMIAKIDKFGVPVWLVKAGGTGNDIAHCVTADKNGNVYVGGFTQSSSCVFTGTSNITLNASSSADFFVAKFNSSGSVLWVKTGSGMGNDEVLGIVNDDSYVYAGGYFSGNLTLPSSGGLTSNGGEDMFVIKYDLDGNIIWREKEGGLGNDRCTGITVSQSDVYVCGYSTNGIDYEGSPDITKSAVGPTGSDIALAKLDASGDVVWAVSEGNTNNCSATSISVLKNNVVIGGTYVGLMIYNTNTVIASANNDMFFASYTRNGAFKSIWSGASAGDEYVNGLSSDERFIYVAGKFANTINFGGTSGVATSASNLFLACYDSLFSLQFVKFSSGSSGNQAYSVSSNQNGIVSVTGSYNTSSIQFAPLTALSSSVTEDFYVASITNCPLVTNNTITGNSTVCSASAPSSFTGSVPAGGNGIFHFIWQQSADASNWTAANGTNTLTNYGAPTLTQTLYYRRVVSSCTDVNFSNTLTVTVVPPPSVASAGLDQLNLCGVTSATLAANNPAIGTGSWTVISGTGGSFLSATNPTTTFNGIAGTSYTLNWTISNAPCSASFDDVVIVFNQNPTISNAGLDQLNLCGVTSTTLAANNPAIGTGSWTVISGTGGSFLSATNPTTTFTGIAGTSYTLNWTISNAPCGASFDDVVIVFNQNPTISNAGLDQLNLCGVTSTTLAANNPAIGTGSWTVISGTGGSFLSATNPTTTFTGIAGTSYTLNWTISNAPCSASFDDVVIVLNQNPTISNAGLDQLNLCGVPSTTLAANNPAIGTGSWTVISGTGGSFLSATNPTTTFTGIAGTSYTLRWTISNAPCTASFDDVTITFNQNPTTSAAGLDQLSLCGVVTTTLAGNTAAVGTGSWTVISGAGGSFLSATNPTTTFNGIAGTSYTLNWTISNTPCSASFDDVVIVFNQNPSSADAGPDQVSLCGTTTASLMAVNAGVGTGAWSVLSGSGGNFSNAASAVSLFIGQPANLYVLRWTVTNAPCVASFDDVNILFNLNPTIASAGTDQLLCGQSTILSANAASVGTGSWTVQSGTGGLFGNSLSATSTFTGNTGSNYVLRWTISNSICADSYDELNVNFNQSPLPANAGSDQTVCATNAALAANSASVGSGIWTILSGEGGSFGDVTNPTAFFYGTEGGFYILRWSVSNSPCADTYDDVTILLSEPPTKANAGADRTICTNTILLGANMPIKGTGQWRLISGAGSLSSQNVPSVNVLDLGPGLNQFAWQITFRDCPASIDTIAINVDALPTSASAGGDIETTLNSVYLQANVPEVGIGNWSLLSGTGTFDNETNAGTQFTFASEGTSYLLWSISNGVCPVSTDTVRVVKNGLFVPELITPNNDGNNDFLFINVANDLDDVKIEIFNRWGTLVYKNLNYKNDFVGKNNEGLELTDETYFVLLSIPTYKVHTSYLVISRK